MNRIDILLVLLDKDVILWVRMLVFMGNRCFLELGEECLGYFFKRKRIVF